MQLHDFLDYTASNASKEPEDDVEDELGAFIHKLGVSNEEVKALMDELDIGHVLQLHCV